MKLILTRRKTLKCVDEPQYLWKDTKGDSQNFWIYGCVFKSDGNWPKQNLHSKI